MASGTNLGGQERSDGAAAARGARPPTVTDRLERPMLVLPRPASAAHRPVAPPPRRPCAAERPRSTHPSAQRPSRPLAAVAAAHPRPARGSAALRRRRTARRSASVGLFAVLLATCAVWVQGGGGRTGSGPLAAPGAGRTETVALRTWVVRPGDTLWSIAHRLEPSGDIRPLVDALSHEVHGRPLQIGQQLRLP